MSSDLQDIINIEKLQIRSRESEMFEQIINMAKMRGMNEIILRLDELAFASRADAALGIKKLVNEIKGIR